MSDVIGYYMIQVMEDMAGNDDTGISGTISDILESAYESESQMCIRDSDRNWRRYGLFASQAGGRWEEWGYFLCPYRNAG